MMNHNRNTTGRIVSNYAVRIAVVVAVLLAGVTVGAGSAVAGPVSSVDEFPEADSDAVFSDRSAEPGNAWDVPDGTDIRADSPDGTTAPISGPHLSDDDTSGDTSFPIGMGLGG